jgi:hypothetical protein
MQRAKKKKSSQILTLRLEGQGGNKKAKVYLFALNSLNQFLLATSNVLQTQLIFGYSTFHITEECTHYENQGTKN